VRWWGWGGAPGEAPPMLCLGLGGPLDQV
jgi:hypothetical protein